MTRPDDSEARADGTSLRGLTGRGPSQVGVSAALRARDVSRPTQRQLADAEALALEVASQPQRRTRSSRRPRPNQNQNQNQYRRA